MAALRHIRLSAKQKRARKRARELMVEAFQNLATRRQDGCIFVRAQCPSKQSGLGTLLSAWIHDFDQHVNCKLPNAPNVPSHTHKPGWEACTQPTDSSWWRPYFCDAVLSGLRCHSVMPPNVCQLSAQRTQSRQEPTLPHVRTLGIGDPFQWELSLTHRTTLA